MSNNRTIDFRKLFEKISVPIHIWQKEEEDFVFIYYNKANNKIAGGNLEKALGMKASDLIKDRPELMKNLNKCFDEKSSFRKQIEYIYKTSGKKRWLDVRYQFIPPNYIVVTNIDISFQKQIEFQYSKADFYKSLIAHDMNNILQNLYSSMEIFSEMVKSENLEDNEDIINLMSEQIARGIRLINNVRTISRLEKQKFSLKKLDLVHTLNETIELIKQSYKMRNVNIKFRFRPDKSVYVKANSLLEDVFENIMVNAIKHNDSENILIEIQIEEEDDFLNIIFKDNGIGIPDKMKKDLFKEELKLDKSVGGMGLGLTLVDTLINSYGGTIEVKDKVEGDYSKGSKFLIKLPKCSI